MEEIAGRFNFFFNDTATTEIYTLSLHDALPIFKVGYGNGPLSEADVGGVVTTRPGRRSRRPTGRDACRQPAHGRAGRIGPEIGRSTRLNSSHANISYAVFCLKKKYRERSRHSAK